MAKADKEGQRKAPILRFKGFTDDWEQRKLNDIAKVYDGIHETPNYTTCGIPFVSVENIRTLTTKKYVSKSFYEEKFKIKPQYDDILMTRIGDIGTSNVVSKVPLAYYVSLALIRLNTEQNAYFFKYFFDSEYAQKELWSRTLHIAFPKKINKNEIGKINIYTTCIKEENKIAQLFNKLNSLLTLYERKLKLLSQVKKYFLDNLFAKREYPNLRFKGFTDTWEQRQLNEVADVVSGGTPATDFSEYWNGNINWFTPNEINSQIYFSKSKRKISNLGLKKSSAKLLPANKSILFTSRATIGEMGILTQDATTNQGFQSLVLHNEVIPYFIFSMKSTLKRQAIKKASGSTFLEISKREVEKLKIVIPSEKEQKKVSMLFKSIDNLFTLYKNKQHHLTEIKKSLLNTMFI